MGLLSVGTPLPWDQAAKHAGHVRENGIEQLICAYDRLKDRTNDCLRWGDEVEYIVAKVDAARQSYSLAMNAEAIIAALTEGEEGAGGERQEDDCHSLAAIWHPEYARYMVEGTPAKPYCHGIKDLLVVEANMRARRAKVQAILGEGERIFSIGNFFRLGCPDAFVQEPAAPLDGTSPLRGSLGDAASLPPIDRSPARLSNEASKSLYFPDEFINVHARFKTLTRNIRKRRGRKVNINVPLFIDRNTKPGTGRTEESLFPDAAELGDTSCPEGMIHMDAMGFGMGCCCLQITFQACTIAEARHLFDQLAVLCPIVMAMTAATPIYRGLLSDVDCRWNVISAAVDDRTVVEGEQIPKSRYASVSRFISTSPKLKAKYNDLAVPLNTKCYEKLIAHGFDELLASHFAWLFVRDPIVVFEELLEQDNAKSMDHFENIQSTNWQTMRFKPPPPSTTGEGIGWRVEFRPMEVQMSDFENAAFAIFVLLLTRTILSLGANFYVPISKVDENMATAQRRDAVLNGLFHFRCDPFDRDPSLPIDKEYGFMSIDQIVNGPPASADGLQSGATTAAFPGLLPMIRTYLDGHNLELKTRAKIDTYLEFIGDRASGRAATPARWMRSFVAAHEDYRGDSIVSSKIAYDLLNAIHERSME